MTYPARQIVIAVGQFHQLSVVEFVAGGVLLGAGEHDLFLPSHLVARDVTIGQPIEVFVYTDREGAPQATTKVPLAILGDIAYLRCVSVTPAGAYLDWACPKDLYVPPDHQPTLMVEGRSYVVAVCMDRKGERLMGSGQLAEHFDYDVADVQPGAAVDLLVHGHSDAGVHVVVNRRHRGLIHRSDVYQKLAVGDELQGFVRQIRDDNRLDIGLTRPGFGGIQDAQATILAALRAAGGSLPLHDGSSPEAIERALHMSKKAFKRGVGGLYKAEKIAIDPQGIRLLAGPDEP